MRRFVAGSIVLLATALSGPTTALGQDCEPNDAGVLHDGVRQYQTERRYPSERQRESNLRFVVLHSTTPASLTKGLRLSDLSVAIDNTLLDLRLRQALGRRPDGLLAVPGRGLQAADMGAPNVVSQRRSAALFRDTDAVAIGEHWAGIYHRLGLGRVIRPPVEPEPGPLATLIA